MNSYTIIVSILALFFVSQSLCENESGRFISTLISDLTSNFPSKDSINFNITKPQFEQGGDGEDLAAKLQNAITSFVNQTRQTLPDIVHIGNFTLIQGALLFAIGSMAAGAAVIVLEGLAFRNRETEIDLYNRLKNQQETGAYGIPQTNYGKPQDSYSSHSSPVASYVPFPSDHESSLPQEYGGVYDMTHSRKKRDTGQHYPQIKKSYGKKTHGHATSYPESQFNLQQQQLNFPVSSYGAASNLFPYSTNGQGFASSYDLFSQNPTNYLLLNRLGMKRKPFNTNHGTRRRVSTLSTINEDYDDNDAEPARGIPIHPKPKHHLHKSKRHRKIITHLELPLRHRTLFVEEEKLPKYSRKKHHNQA